MTYSVQISNLVSNKEEFCVDSYDLSLGNRVVKFILEVFITYQMSNVAHDKQYAIQIRYDCAHTP